MQTTTMQAAGRLNRPIVSHAVGMVFPQVTEDGRLELLIQRYGKPDRMQQGQLRRTWRHIMETGASAGARLRLTRERGAQGELFDTTYLQDKEMKVVKLRVLSRLPIAYALLPDEVDQFGLHLKVLFMHRILLGEIRHLPKIDGDEELDPPVWVEWSKAFDLMQKSPRTHFLATRAVLEWFAGRDKRVTFNYLKYLGGNSALPDWDSPEGRKVRRFIRTNW